MASRMLARLRRQPKYRYYYVVEFSTGLQLWSSCQEMLASCVACLPTSAVSHIVACYCTWKPRGEWITPKQGV
jgi:hypothetical protein